ncbi:MAG: hypothetical protein LBJ00_18490 [Planctomycetaceae bacterium]|nr:hypothetical protein [Planctomycetaceae bacterium]
MEGKGNTKNIGNKKHRLKYTVAGKAIGFALEQPLHVVTLTCSASGISV